MKWHAYIFVFNEIEISYDEMWTQTKPKINLWLNRCEHWLSFRCFILNFKVQWIILPNDYSYYYKLSNTSKINITLYDDWLFATHFNVRISGCWVIWKWKSASWKSAALKSTWWQLCFSNDWKCIDLKRNTYSAHLHFERIPHLTNLVRIQCVLFSVLKAHRRYCVKRYAPARTLSPNRIHSSFEVHLFSFYFLIFFSFFSFFLCRRL